MNKKNEKIRTPRIEWLEREIVFSRAVLSVQDMAQEERDRYSDKLLEAEEEYKLRTGRYFYAKSRQ